MVPGNVVAEDSYDFENEYLLENGTRSRTSWFQLRGISPLVLHTLFFAMSLSMLVASLGRNLVLERRCTGVIDMPSPIFEDLNDRTQTIRFNGFKAASPFKGPPSRQVDEAWASIVYPTGKSIP
jgi:hypothetical protein